MSSCVCKILFKSEQICGCYCKMLRGSLFWRHMVNACEYAIACVLAQQDDDRNDRPVAVASVKLSPSQRAWATIEKEAYAACRSLGSGCFGLQ